MTADCSSVWTELDSVVVLRLIEVLLGDSAVVSVDVTSSAEEYASDEESVS